MNGRITAVYKNTKTESLYDDGHTVKEYPAEQTTPLSLILGRLHLAHRAPFIFNGTTKFLTAHADGL